MKKVIKPILAVLIILIIVIISIYYFFFSLQRLPKGELINSYISPDGSYTINMYLCNGGATTDYAVRGELNDGKTIKNIYWEYHTSTSNVEWKDEYTVYINGRILDVRYDVYDWRNAHD